MTGYDLQLIATEVQVNFKDFSRPNKEINYRIQGLFKTTTKI